MKPWLSNITVPSTQMIHKILSQPHNALRKDKRTPPKVVHLCPDWLLFRSVRLAYLAFNLHMQLFFFSILTDDCGLFFLI